MVITGGRELGQTFSAASDIFLKVISVPLFNVALADFTYAYELCLNVLSIGSFIARCGDMALR